MSYHLPWIKVLGLLIGLLFIHQGVYHSTGVNMAPRISSDKLPQLAFDDASSSAAPHAETYAILPVLLVPNLDNQVSHGTCDAKPPQELDNCSSEVISPACPQVILPRVQEQPGNGEFAWTLDVWKGTQDWFSSGWLAFENGGE